MEMNCKEKVEEIIAKLDNSEYWDVEGECQDEWNKDYAVFLVYIMEEEYRDYDAIEDEIFDCIKNIVGKKVTIIHGRDKTPAPTSGYILHIWGKMGISYEIELYKAKKSK